MTAAREVARWCCAALLAVALLLDPSAARASESWYVGARPVPVKARPNTRSTAVATLPPGTKVMVFDRENGWCWVVVAVTKRGMPTPPGWVRQEWLVTDIPDQAGEPTQPVGAAAVEVAPAVVESAGANPPAVAAEAPPLSTVVPVTVAAEAPPLSTVVPVTVAAEVPPLSTVVPVAVAAEAPPLSTVVPVAVAAEVPPLAAAVPVAVAAEVPAPAAAVPVAVAAEVPQLTTVPPVAEPIDVPATADTPSLAEVAAAAASASRPGRAMLPPPPIGSDAERGAAFAGWFKPRSLRASVGFDYQEANVHQDSNTLNHRELGGLATVAASFAVLDPQIFSVDFSGEFQLNRTTNSSSGGSFLDTSNMNSYRLDVGVLSGRSAPLRLYTDRTSISSLFQSGGNGLDSLRHVQGVRTTNGFTWDVSAPHLPRVQLSASTGLQTDDRDYLFGYSSTNRERRAELRVSGARPTVQFDADLVHSDVLYDVPGAGLSSRTGNDLFYVTTRLAPSKRLFIDLHARASRFDLGSALAGSSVTGVGGDGTIRFQVTKNLSATGRYSRSSNAVEAILSHQLDPGQAGGGPVPTSSLNSRTVYSDGEARLDYSSRPFTAAAVFKTVSFGVPVDLAPTLTTLTTGGVTIRVEHSVHALLLSAGADASAGTARSNQGVREPYREGGVQVGASTPTGHAVRLSADGNFRRVARLDFYPVSLQSTFVTGRIETTRPRWAAVHASITRYDSLRDILYADARDRHTGGTLGIGSRWYDVAVDINQTNTNPILLSPSILGNRPDVIALLASTPDLLRNLLVSGDRSKAVSIQIRPYAGLTIQARIHRMDQEYPGLFGFTLRGEQLTATYQLRQVQLEFGVETYDSTTTFGNVRDSRIYFRVRRDLLFIK